MAWHERDYYREYDAPRFGRFAGWTVTIWLIAINVAVFVVDHLLASFLRLAIPPLTYWGHFSVATAISHLEIWRFFTFQFLHASLGHLFFNMLGLYFFGPMVESYLGSRRFLAFYLLCGMAGAALYMILLAGNVLIGAAWVPLVGASAGIFGILMAAAQIAPDTTVMLLFPPIPMRLRTMAYVMLGIAAFMVLSQGRNAGGEAAHLGGAGLGYLLIYKPQLLNVFTFSWGRKRMRMRRDDFWQGR